MDEVWKEIAGYDGVYKISNLGRVKNSKGLIMAQKPSKDGYVRINLFKGKKYKAEYVHILVAKHFVTKPDVDGLEVNHIDGVKNNNNVSNLEWVTKSQNTRHAIEHNLRFVNPTMGRYGKDNPGSKPTAQYSFDGVLVRVWDSRKDAADYYGIRRGAICAAVNGRKKSCVGYLWRNADSCDIPDKIQAYKTNINIGRKLKKVVQISKDGTIVRVWGNAKKIGEETGFSPSSILRCCDGKRQFAYGYIWKYADDSEVSP